uniref:Protein kinase n=1 Tax=Pithovirus LCPAC104 TaxID=2506589 RepID=A0A481Z5H1_9VIRU|nr:MAG: protein kinase [Pithovirus LCPAC104]
MSITDNIFSIWKKQKKFIINIINNEPYQLNEEFWSIIEKDFLCSCICNEEKNIDTLLSINYNQIYENLFLCHSCENLKRLTNNYNGKFIIESGDNKNKEIITDRIEIKENFKLVNNNNFIKNDSLTNRILITWFIEDKIPFVENIYSTFVCKNIQNIVKEYYEIESLDYLLRERKLTNITSSSNKIFTKKIVINIIKQLFVALSMLNEYDFVYGNYNIKPFKITNVPIELTYYDIIIKSDISIKIIDLYDSGITTNDNYRIFNNNELYEFLYILNKENPIYYEGDIFSFPEWDNPKKISMAHYLRKKGFGKNITAYDAYYFMINIMLNINFYLSIKNYPNIYKIWESMWNENEFEKINKILNDFHENNIDRKQVLNMLNSFHFNSNVIKIVLNNIKNI